MRPIRIAPPIMLAAVALAAAGCGGSASSSGHGATGTVAGTVATLTTSTSTTAQGSTSFDVQFGQLRRRLVQALTQLRNGDVASAGTVLTACTDTATRQLGARAQTPKQQQAVSQLRTACDDVSQALSRARSGDTSAAKRLAGDALRQLPSAAGAAR